MNPITAARRERLKKLLCEGKTCKEVHDILGVSLRTIENDVAKLRRESDAKTLLRLGYVWGKLEASDGNS